MAGPKCDAIVGGPAWGGCARAAPLQMWGML